MDSVSEERLKDVHPILAAKVRQMADVLNHEGIYIRVVQALRTIGEQDRLYEQGRTAPGHIVTNCPGGHSYHNFGLAVDCVPSNVSDAVPFVPDWNPKHPTWKRMEQVGAALGLDCGADWRTFHDYPHFQLTGVFPEGHPPEAALRAYQYGGMAGVWKAAGIVAAEGS